MMYMPKSIFVWECADDEHDGLVFSENNPGDAQEYIRKDEYDKLVKRLEIDPRHTYDGIEARDETIAMLERRLENAERKRR